MSFDTLMVVMYVMVLSIATRFWGQSGEKLYDPNSWRHDRSQPLEP
jgi:hypothetical protein